MLCLIPPWLFNFIILIWTDYDLELKLKINEKFKKYIRIIIKLFIELIFIVIIIYA